MTAIVTVKVSPALFAFKNRDRRFTQSPVQTDGRDVNPETRSRSSDLHRAATETTVVRPTERLFFQASVRFRFAGGHDLFCVAFFRKAGCSTQIDCGVVVESTVLFNPGKLGHGIQAPMNDPVALCIVDDDWG